MKPHTPEDIHAYAKWLTTECRAAGLGATQYGAQILIQGATGHLTERITCRPDEHGELRWYWSWGAPITCLTDPARILDAEEVAEPARAITNVVALPNR